MVFKVDVDWCELKCFHRITRTIWSTLSWRRLLCSLMPVYPHSSLNRRFCLTHTGQWHSRPGTIFNHISRSHRRQICHGTTIQNNTANGMFKIHSHPMNQVNNYILRVSVILSHACRHAVTWYSHIYVYMAYIDNIRAYIIYAMAITIICSYVAIIAIEFVMSVYTAKDWHLATHMHVHRRTWLYIAAAART